MTSGGMDENNETVPGDNCWCHVSLVDGERAPFPVFSPRGFVAVRLHTEDRLGEVYMIAVDPDCQGRGIGSALMTVALRWMTDAGLSVAMVETGDDPGHAPARRTYEKLGFGVVPVARYYKKL